jgi:tRNA(Ile)-lysidine synthase
VPKSKASAIRSKSNALTLSAVQLQLNQFLATHLKSGQHLLLALSGGLDSSVLLHLLANAKSSLGVKLSAMHVHHGLSPNADAWASFCVQECQQLQVPLQVAHVQVEKNPDVGVEAAARRLRYEALFNAVVGDASPDFIVTAHHEDDQAETLILQLMRGAGVKGLASMAAIDPVRRLLRPLLGITRQQLHDYAKLHAITWCDDESNANTHYERNFVRHTLMPMLAERSPAISSVLARTASHMAEANTLLDDLASIDAQTLVLDNSVCVSGLSTLSQARAKNVLRYWLARNHLAMPHTEQLTEILHQLLNAKVDANINIPLQHLSVKRFQQRVYLCREQVAQEFNLVWNGEPFLDLPNGGQLIFKQEVGAGLALKFGMTKLRITNRDGGERFKPNALRPTRTLKHLLQEANIPPWQRTHLPLVYWHDTLAYVPSIGIAHELQAQGEEAGIVISWQDVGADLA